MELAQPGAGAGGELALPVARPHGGGARAARPAALPCGEASGWRRTRRRELARHFSLFLLEFVAYGMFHVF